MASMRIAAAVLIVSLIGLFPTDASAIFGARGIDGDFLSKQDVEIMNKTGLALLKSGKAGDKADWSNPETKSRGTITLGDKFTHQGMNCRRVELENVPKGNEISQVWYKHAVCDVPGTGWRYLY